MRSRRSRTIHAALVTAALALLCAPAAAFAGFGIASFSASVEKPAGTFDYQAGDHPDVGITAFTMNTSGGAPAGTLSNVRVDLPPGLISNPQATAKCPANTSDVSTCPANTQVGTVTVVAHVLLSNTTITANVYNMVPPPGKVSDFAFDAKAVGVVDLGRTDIIGGVRDDSDYGLFFTIDLSGNPTAGQDLVSSALTFFGTPGAHNGTGSTTPFLTLPTKCGDIVTTRLTVTSSTGQTDTTGSNTAQPGTGCDQVPFAPKITVTPDTTQQDTPTGLTVDLNVPQDTNPNLGTAHVRDAVVTLPPGLTINAGAANGLAACQDSQFPAGFANPISCPAASRIGTATITTPVLAAPLTGGVYLGQPLPGNPYRIFVDAEDAGVGIATRLKGTIVADPTTGQLTTTFADTPQVPFSDFVLHFNGGPGATLATPLACGAATTNAAIVPYSAPASPATPTSAFTVDADGSGGACPAATPFSLGFQAGTLSPIAGAFSPFSLTVSRSDGQQYLSGLSISEPPGLLGQLAGITQCDDAPANAGTCPIDSRVGTATVAAGAGSAPFSLSGPVYLTGPYKGAPFGLAIVERAIAGPFDLGTVVVRAAIRVDPHDSHLTIDSDPLPSVLQGIPLRLRTVTVLIDKDQFIFNPTNCAPMGVGATLTSTGGATQTVSSPFQATGCDALPFTPHLAASTTSRVSRKNGASLTVTLTQPAGQANTKSVSVTLPKQLSARIETVQQACPQATFTANPDACPAASHVGTVAARTPVLEDPLSGPVIIEAHNGSLPTLEALLRGSGITVDLSGTIGLGATLTSTFAAVPDVPITSFRLDLPTGPHSALASSSDMCSGPISMPTAIVGQNGKKIAQTTAVSVPDCRMRILSRKVRGHTATLKVAVPNPGRLTATGKGLRTVRRTVRRAPGVVTLKLKLSKAGKRQLAAKRRAHRKLVLRATVRLVPSGPGSRTKRTARLTFKR